MKLQIGKTRVALVTAFLISTVISLAIPVVMIFVAWHFIHKYW